MTAGEPAGPRNDEPLLPPDDTGEAIGHLPSRLTITFGFGPGAVRARGGRPVRARPAAAGVAAPVRAVARRGDRPGDLGRRPLRAGVLGRSAGRLPRGPQPRPDRPRRRWCCSWSQLGFGRTSTTTREQDTPAQPDGASRTAPTTSGRRTPPTLDRVRVGRRRGPGLAARRDLHGRPPDPDGDRESGTGRSWPSRSARSAAPSTPGAPLGRHRRVRPARFRGARPRGPGDRPRRAHAAQLRGPARQRGSCAAATRSPTASTRSPDSSTPGSSSSASSATRTSSSASSATSPGTSSTSTSSTPRAPCSRSRPARRRAPTSARRCSPDGESVRPRPPPAGRPARGPGAGDRVRVRPRGPGSRP